MAYKVKSECVNPANDTRVFPGGFLDPIPNTDEIKRLTRANAIEERPDAEFEAWKRDEAERAKAAAARPAVGTGQTDAALADRITRIEAELRSQGQTITVLGSRLDQLAPPAAKTK